MADEAEKKSNIPLPPKLDLRKSGVIRPTVVAQPAAPAPQVPVAPAAQAAPAPVPPPAQTHQTTSARPAPTINVAPANPSSSTMHIKISDDVPTIRLGAPVQPQPQAAGPTPTVELKRPVMPVAQARPMTAAKPLTVTPAPAPAATPRPASKTETSRIPLELATSVSSGAPTGKPTGDLKTIKIKASAGLPPARPASMQPAPAPKEQPMDEKRKTSRISLEAALAMEDNKGGESSGGVPKTIRLKRPGETATSKASPVLETVKAASPAGLSQTARLDEEAAQEEEGPSPTRRKTIKVKRPSDRTGVGVAGVALSKGAEGDVEIARGEPDVEEAGGITWFSVTSLVATILAMITTFMIIWMLAAQAFGPNPSLTQLATGTTDLGWFQRKTTPLQ